MKGVAPVHQQRGNLQENSEARPCWRPRRQALLKAPVLSLNQLAERPVERGIVMSHDGVGFHQGRIRTGMTVGDKHRIEAKITCGTAGAVDAVLRLHPGNYHAGGAAGAQIVRQVSHCKSVRPMLFEHHFST